MNKKFELTILGSGSALPTLKHNPPAQVLNVQEKLYLIDCSEGTQVAMRKAKIKIQRINQIFISHLHGDHYLGLPGLLSTYSLLGRKNPIDIFSPVGLKSAIELHFKISGSQPGFPIQFHELEIDDKTLVFENKQLGVWAFPLNHRIKTFGYYFEEKPKLSHIKSSEIEKYKIPHYKIKEIKQGMDYAIPETGETIPNTVLTNPAYPSFSYAYCSDTKYNPKLAQWINKTDLLFHETTFMDKDKHLAEKTFHSTTIQAARIAKMANAKKLIIGHFSSRYHDIREMEKECKNVFENTVVAYDGMVLSVE